MLKQFLTWSILLASTFAQGQMNYCPTDNLNTYYESKRVEVKSNNLKSLKVYSYKNENSKKGKLVLHENYNTDGNITSKVDHKYHRYKDVNEVSYSYDSLARIQEIISRTSFSDGYIDYTDITYFNDKVKFIITDFGKSKEQPFDTTYYIYFPDGKIKARIEKRYSRSFQNYYPLDTTYYHYNKFGDVFRDKLERDTVFDYKIRDRNGCVIGYNDTTSYKYTMECDSFCNCLQYKREAIINEKWVVVYNGEFKYDYKNRTLEEKKFSCSNRSYAKCKGKLKLDTHSKFEYNDKGQNSKEICYNKRGRIIEVIKYIYETYSD